MGTYEDAAEKSAHFSKYLKKLFEGTVKNVDDFEDINSTDEIRAKMLQAIAEKHSLTNPETLEPISRKQAILSQTVLTRMIGNDGWIKKLEFTATEKPPTTDKLESLAYENPDTYRMYVPETPGSISLNRLRDIRDLSRELKDAEGYERRAWAEKVHKLNELKLRVIESEIDPLTGLEGRDKYYEQLEALEKAGVKSQTAFIDMGYLKHLNQDGGREVGNYALQKAAEIGTKALQELLGTKATIYRYGGDEFAILINSDKEEDLKTVLEAIEKNRAELGVIKPTQNSAKNYLGMELSFNYGLSNSDEAKKVYDKFAAQGLLEEDQKAGGAKYFNFLAETQTRIADLSVEQEKATTRLIKMLDLLAERFLAMSFPE
jgi:diguanylate cyclase (GGDEF)-like protein